MMLEKRQLVCLVALITLAALPAWAGEKEEAKQLFDSGLKLMKLNDYSAAAANFERSTTLYSTQNGVVNLAYCYKAMQRYGDALAVLERLKKKYGSQLRPDIRAEAEHQEQEIRSLVALLTIQTVPPDASVTVDGKDAGTGPMVGPMMLAPGEHAIESTRQGYRVQQKKVQLVSGAELTEKLVLQLEEGWLFVNTNVKDASLVLDNQDAGRTPLAKALTVEPGKHVLTVSAPGYVKAERALEIQPGEKQVLEIVLVPASISVKPQPLRESVEIMETPKSQPKSKILPVVMWSSAAGAVAFGAVAVTFLFIANRHYSDFQKYRDQYATEGTGKVDRDSAASQTREARNIAIGCGIGAAALVLTAGITYWLGLEDKPASESKTTVSLSPFGLAVGF
jgi:hypothetical protein